jgi:hypothetical protein
MTAIWPHTYGGHRRDGRSCGLGAAEGRERWRWRAQDGAAISTPHVGEDRIAVVAGTTLCLLDAEGRVRTRVAHGAESSLGLVVAEGPLMIDGARVIALDWAGVPRWERRFEQGVVAVQGGPAGEIAVATHRRGHPPVGELVVLEPDGALRWRVDDHAVVGAPIQAPALAFDDEGTLYSLLTGRLGDGVSGDDVLRGGCRGFDRDGRTRWPGVIGPAFPWEIQASARGVVVVGQIAVIGYDSDGAVQWEGAVDDGAVIPIPALGMDVVRSCAHVELPRLLNRRAGGGGTVHRGVFDRAGTMFFGRVAWSPPRVDAVVALGSDDRVRWSLPGPSVPYATDGPVVGLGASLLLASGVELIAVG